MEIDISGGIKNAYNGMAGTILGQGTDGKSQKWVALVLFTLASVFCVWKLRALDITHVFDGLLRLTMFWMGCHAFERAAGKIADAVATKK